MMATLLNVKSEFCISERCFDSFVEAFHEGLPLDNKLARNIYETKKLVEGLGLPVEKIDCCPQGCMLFWQENSDLLSCKFCGQSRYKPRRASRMQKLIPYRRMFYFPLSPRLKRLYASSKTASDMLWHDEHVCDEGIMCHPCDSEAWKHFNITNVEFASEPRNVRLGLCTDGFQPFGQTGKQYSSWPIILTCYNLPPWLCMKEQYMFLTALVPGPNNPKQKLDVFLQPLISELVHLWENGVDAYDVSVKKNFKLRAALMWTISDFSAYSMLSGWSTAGKHACPYCMENSQAFSLPNGRKTSWFDNHRKFLPPHHTYRNNKIKFIRNRVEKASPPPIRSGEEILSEIKRLKLLKVTDVNSDHVNQQISRDEYGWKKKSIFWDLPYWKTNLIRHNLDVMHIEKNVFDNVFNTIMNIEGKTKDNAKAREDVSLFCNRHELEKDPLLEKYPKASYTLDSHQKKVVCEWVKQLKFSDGYVSNMARCVDDKKCKLYGMKSHDCHVFMQRLLPIAVHEFISMKVWEAITELSFFFKNLSANVIKVDDMARLEEEIPIILCKLEQIFPPAFFDLMEHLPIHLPYEAKIAGPVQYRWMYPFERYLGHLKKMVKNKAHVEGSICNAYLVEEISNFCSYYFEPHVYTRARKVSRNDDGGDQNNLQHSSLSIFSHNGRPSGILTSRWLNDKEHKAVHSYILLNCHEVSKFVEMYMNELHAELPNANNSFIQTEVENNFTSWFLNYGQSNWIANSCIRSMIHGPSKRVVSFPIYFTNGFRFHNSTHSGQRSTSNNGVCVKGDGYEYYGIIEEILEVSYPGLPIRKIVVFKCHWYDPTQNLGMRVHPRYNIIEVNIKRKYNKYEPFILASQAMQVYYVPYPSMKRDKIDWRVVCNVKAKGAYDIPENKVVKKSVIDEAFQEDDTQLIEIQVVDADDIPFADSNFELVCMPIVDSDEEDEFQFETETDEESENDADSNIEYYDSD